MQSADSHHEPRSGRDRQTSHPDDPGNHEPDPCLPFQLDLSSMLDGELDPAGIRRAMRHADGCGDCKSFLDGIREQAGMHRRLVAAVVLPDDVAAATLACAAGGRASWSLSARGSSLPAHAIRSDRARFEPRGTGWWPGRP